MAMMIVVAIVMMAVSYGVSMLMAPGPQHNNSSSSSLQEGSRLSDLSVQTANYGASIPVVWGAMRFAGTVLWSRPIDEETTTSTTVTTITQTSKSGKGGGSKSTSTSSSTDIQITYNYFITMASGICAGPIAAITRVWANSKLVVDLTPGNPGLKYKYAENIYTFYEGNPGQGIDPTMSSFDTTPQTPAYRDWAYMVVKNFPLADFGNSIPQFTFEVVSTSVQISTGNLVTGTYGAAPGNAQFFVADPNGALAVSSQGAHVLIGVNRLSNQTIWTFDTSTQTLNFKTGWFFTGTGLIVNGVFWACMMTGSNSQFYLVGFDVNSGQQTQTINLCPASVSYLYFFVSGIMCIDGAIIPVGDPETDCSAYLSSGTLVKTGGDYFVSCTGSTSGYGVVLSTSTPMTADGKTFIGIVTTDGCTSNGQDAILLKSGLTLTNYSGTPTTYMTGTGTAAFMDLDSGHVIVVTVDSSWGRGGIWRVDPASWTVQAAILNMDGPIFSITGSGGTNTITTSVALSQAYIGGFIDVSGVGTIIPDGTWITAISGSTVTLSNALMSDVAGNVAQIESSNWGGGMTTASSQNAPTLNTNFNTVTNSRTVMLNVATMMPVKSVKLSTVNWTNGSGSTMYDYWYDSYTCSSYVRDQGVYVLDLGRQTAGAITDGDVVAWLSGMVGVTNIDVSQLTDTFNGWFLSKQARVRDCLDQLKTCFLFDAAEISGNIVYRKRTNPVVTWNNFTGTVPFEDITFKLDGNKNSNMIKESRQQEIEIPRRLTVRYANYDNAFQAGSQVAQRMIKTTEAKGDMTFDTPLCITDSVAANMAQQMLGTMWSERAAVEFMLPPKYMLLDPTDVIIIEKIDREVGPSSGTNNGTLTYISVRLTEVSLLEGYIVSCKGVVTNSVSTDEYVDIGGLVSSNYVAPTMTPQVINPIPASAITMNYSTTATSGNWMPNTAYSVGTIVTGT